MNHEDKAGVPSVILPGILVNRTRPCKPALISKARTWIMSRVTSMTLGLVLIFLGVQLYLVKSYLLTPTATRFVQENFSSNRDSIFTSSSGIGPGLAGNSSSGLFNQQGVAPQAFANPSSSIGQVPAGQHWPYYSASQSAPAGQPGLFSNSSFLSGGIANPSSGPLAASGVGTRFVPPKWIMWPALFLGAVFFLHGVALRG